MEPSSGNRADSATITRCKASDDGRSIRKRKSRPNAFSSRSGCDAEYLTGGTLNIYSQIGLVTLIGLITKHGILIVQFANRLQDEGRSLREAVTEAASLRLRPILMTTGAMVSGALPLAVAAGAGAESRHEVGWVIVGGMSVGTLLTLFVVPTAYTLLARDRARKPAPTAGHEPEKAAGPAE